MAVSSHAHRASTILPKCRAVASTSVSIEASREPKEGVVGRDETPLAMAGRTRTGDCDLGGGVL